MAIRGFETGMFDGWDGGLLASIKQPTQPQFPEITVPGARELPIEGGVWVDPVPRWKRDGGFLVDLDAGPPPGEMGRVEDYFVFGYDPLFDES